MQFVLNRQRDLECQGSHLFQQQPADRFVNALAGNALADRLALFDAVARLPHKQFDPIEFTRIDHFDQVKPDQALAFRRTIETSIAGKKVQLHGYDQTGRGIMPFTYWVDNQGRTIVAISGLEAYLLTA